MSDNRGFHGVFCLTDGCCFTACQGVLTFNSAGEDFQGPHRQIYTLFYRYGLFAMC